MKCSRFFNENGFLENVGYRLSWCAKLLGILVFFVLSADVDGAIASEPLTKFRAEITDQNRVPELVWIDTDLSDDYYFADFSLRCDSASACEGLEFQLTATCSSMDCETYRGERYLHATLEERYANLSLGIEELGLAESDFDKGDTFVVETDVTVADEDGPDREGTAQLEVRYNGPNPGSETGCGGCDEYTNAAPVRGSLVLALIGFAVLRVRPRRGPRWN